MSAPEMGLVCNSEASNTGHLTGLAALEVVRKIPKIITIFKKTLCGKVDTVE